MSSMMSDDSLTLLPFGLPALVACVLACCVVWKCGYLSITDLIASSIVTSSFTLRSANAMTSSIDSLLTPSPKAVILAFNEAISLSFVEISSLNLLSRSLANARASCWRSTSVFCASWYSLNFAKPSFALSKSSTPRSLRSFSCAFLASLDAMPLTCSHVP